MDAGASDAGVSSKPDLMSCGCSGSPSSGLFTVVAVGVLLALRRSRRSTALAVALLVPAFASAAERPSVAVLGLRPLNGVKPDLASVVTSQLASGVSSRGFRVITPAEVEVLLGAERQRQLMGCTENACSAELAGALGSDFIVNGSLANVGTSAVVELTLINTKTSAVEQRFASRVKNGTEEAFLDVLPSALDALFPAPPDATAEGSRRFGVDLRGQLALQGLGTNWHGNFGPVVTYRVMPWLELGVGALISRTPGGFARGAVVLGNSWPVQLLLAVEVPVLAAGTPAVGLTGSVGVEWRPVPVLALRAEIPVTYFFIPEATTNFFLLGSLSAGARF